MGPCIRHRSTDDFGWVRSTKDRLESTIADLWLPGGAEQSRCGGTRWRSQIGGPLDEAIASAHEIRRNDARGRCRQAWCHVGVESSAQTPAAIGNQIHGMGKTQLMSFKVGLRYRAVDRTIRLESETFSLASTAALMTAGYILDFFVGHFVDVDLTRQPAS